MAMCKYVVLFWAVLLAAAVVAGPDHSRIDMAIADDAGKQAFRFGRGDNVIIDGNAFVWPSDVRPKDCRNIYSVRSQVDVAG